MLKTSSCFAADAWKVVGSIAEAVRASPSLGDDLLAIKVVNNLASGDEA